MRDLCIFLTGIGLVMLSTGIGETCLGQDCWIEEIYVIKNGKAQRLSEEEGAPNYVERSDIAGSKVDATRKTELANGDTITARIGANVLLKDRDGGETWLNYDTTVRFWEGVLHLVNGETLNRKVRRRLFMHLLGVFHTQTDYYAEVDSERETETIYVLKGRVTVRGPNEEELRLTKGQAGQLRGGRLDPIKLYKPDEERVLKWNKTVGDLRRSWIGSLVRLPFRYPTVTVAIIGAGAAYVTYEMGQSNSELDVSVTF